MKDNYARPLIENPLVESFLIDVLGVNKDENLSSIVRRIVSAELKMKPMIKKETMLSDSYRDYNYRDDDDRNKLRNLIIKEIITLARIEDDDSITLGNGGARPTSCEPKTDKSAYIVIGPPASGKSTVSNLISEHTGGIIVDSDYVKRKLPEFNQDNGASLVHSESSALTFGDKNMNKEQLTLYDVCVSYGYNMVIPKIGHDSDSVLKLARKLKSDDYDIHLILVSLDRKKSTQRALHRFLDTGRYVPLSLIFDGYANDPILTYYRIRENNIFLSYGKVSTDVEKGKPPIFKECTSGNPVEIFKKGE